MRNEINKVGIFGCPFSQQRPAALTSPSEKGLLPLQLFWTIRWQPSNWFAEIRELQRRLSWQTWRRICFQTVANQATDDFAVVKGQGARRLWGLVPRYSVSTPISPKQPANASDSVIAAISTDLVLLGHERFGMSLGACDVIAISQMTA